MPMTVEEMGAGAVVAVSDISLCCGWPMDYKIDADRKGFHVWLSAAEFAKVQGDARRVGVPLDEYLQEIMLWGVSQAVKMGLQPREGESHLVVTANRRE